MEGFALGAGAYILSIEAIDASSQEIHNDKMLLVIGE